MFLRFPPILHHDRPGRRISAFPALCTSVCDSHFSRFSRPSLLPVLFPGLPPEYMVGQFPRFSLAWLGFSRTFHQRLWLDFPLVSPTGDSCVTFSALHVSFNDWIFPALTLTVCLFVLSFMSLEMVVFFPPL